MWQLGILVGAPVGIGLVAGIAVPAMIIGAIYFTFLPNLDTKLIKLIPLIFNLQAYQFGLAEKYITK